MSLSHPAPRNFGLKSEKYTIFSILFYLVDKSSAGNRDSWVMKLYELPDDEIENVLQQLCHLFKIWPEEQGESLGKFLVYKCTQSVHLALKIICPKPEQCERLLDFVLDCEMSLVNSELMTRTSRPGGAVLSPHRGSNPNTTANASSNASASAIRIARMEEDAAIRMNGQLVVSGPSSAVERIATAPESELSPDVVAMDLASFLSPDSDRLMLNHFGPGVPPPLIKASSVSNKSTGSLGSLPSTSPPSPSYAEQVTIGAVLIPPSPPAIDSKLAEEQERNERAFLSAGSEELLAADADATGVASSSSVSSASASDPLSPSISDDAPQQQQRSRRPSGQHTPGADIAEQQPPLHHHTIDPPSAVAASAAALHAAAREAALEYTRTHPLPPASVSPAAVSADTGPAPTAESVSTGSTGAQPSLSRQVSSASTASLRGHVRKPLFCPAAHPLVFTRQGTSTRANIYTCSVCLRDGLSYFTLGAWHCEPCDFDMCSSCAAKLQPSSAALSPTAASALTPPGSPKAATERSDQPANEPDTASFPADSAPLDGDQCSSGNMTSSSELNYPGIESDQLADLLFKQVRSEYFNCELGFIKNLEEVSLALVKLPREQRSKQLRTYFMSLNAGLVRGLYIPGGTVLDRHYKILRISPEHGVALNSRDKAPFLMLLEVSLTGKLCGDSDIYSSYMTAADMLRRLTDSSNSFPLVGAPPTRSPLSLSPPLLNSTLPSRPSQPTSTSQSVDSFRAPSNTTREAATSQSSQLKTQPSALSLSSQQHRPSGSSSSSATKAPSECPELIVIPEARTAGECATVGGAVVPNRSPASVQDIGDFLTVSSPSPGAAAGVSASVSVSAPASKHQSFPVPPRPDIPSAHVGSVKDELTESLATLSVANDTNPERAQIQVASHAAAAFVAVGAGALTPNQARSAARGASVALQSDDQQPASADFTQTRFITPLPKSSEASNAQSVSSSSVPPTASSLSSPEQNATNTPEANAVTQPAAGTSDRAEGRPRSNSNWDIVHVAEPPLMRTQSDADGSALSDSSAPSTLPSSPASSSVAVEPQRSRTSEPVREAAPVLSSALLQSASASGASPTAANVRQKAQRMSPTALAAFGEPWQAKAQRLRLASPFKNEPNWSLVSVIYKGGDDCRQEHMAMQLIMMFDKIWKDAQLPLHLTPYFVLVTSPKSGIIQTVQNAPSIDSLKKNTPGFTTLAKFFEDAFGRKGTREFQLAQRNFVESMAAYSIVCFLLQIKDRHNGNILLDSQGHIVHIDFGFMLSNSPGGNFNFENVPFKLTREYIEVMDGEDSDSFNYFKLLIIRGFLEARKHANEFLLLVETMFTDSNMACFVGGPASLVALRNRFCLNMTEGECMEYAVNMVEQSCDNWRTVQYDNYQRMTNGIL